MWGKQFSLLALLASFAHAQNSKPDFTGTWKCQEYEVDEIRHQDPVFEISPRIGRADVIWAYEFRTDGHVVPVKRYGSEEVIRTASWDGRYLVLETKRIGNNGQTTEKITVSISSNRTELTKHTQRFGANNHKTVDDTLVFHKIRDGIRGIQVGDSKDVVAREWGPPKAIEQKDEETTFIYGTGSESLEVLFSDKKVKELRPHEQ